jgi:hypothetical protein
MESWKVEREDVTLQRPGLTALSSMTVRVRYFSTKNPRKARYDIDEVGWRGKRGRKRGRVGRGGGKGKGGGEGREVGGGGDINEVNEKQSK